MRWLACLSACLTGSGGGWRMVARSGRHPARWVVIIGSGKWRRALSGWPKSTPKGDGTKTASGAGARSGRMQKLRRLEALYAAVYSRSRWNCVGSLFVGSYSLRLFCPLPGRHYAFQALHRSRWDSSDGAGVAGCLVGLQRALLKSLQREGPKRDPSICSARPVAMRWPGQQRVAVLAG